MPLFPDGAIWGGIEGTLSDQTDLQAALDAKVSSPVTTADIGDNQVTFAKIQDISEFSVIGKSTTGSGDPTDVTASDETVLGRTGGGNLVFAQVATGQVANDAITYAKLQNVSAASRLIGRGSAAGAGDPEEITLGTNLSMSGTTLNASGGGSVPTGTGFRHVTAGVEDAAAKLVDTADVNDDQITDAKLRESAGVSVIGRSANSTGNPADIVAGADGDVLRRDSGVVGFGTIAQSSVIGLVAALAGKFKQVVMQVFTADGTYTPTTGMKYCLVIATGAGGGGGGADTPGASGQVGVGGGGGAGGTTINLYDAATIGASQAVTVPSAGGAGGSGTDGTDGTVGGNTVFGSLSTAPGGGPGQGSALIAATFSARNGGAGGNPSSFTNQIALTGGYGDDGIGFSVNGTTDICFGKGGIGGASFWGGGGGAAILAQTSLTADQQAIGNNGSRYGTGGGGAACLTSTTGANGGNGGPGVIVVLEFIGD